MVLILLLFTVTTTSAMSCLPPHSIDALDLQGSVVYAHLESGRWGWSEDGGRSWDHPYGTPPPVGAPEGFPERPHLPVVTCVPHQPERCYRVAGEPEVEVSDDGGMTWRVAWGVPLGRRSFLERAHTGRGVCTHEPEVGARDLLVVPRGESHRVVAALSHQGVLVGEGGQAWERVGVGQARPQPFTQPLRFIGREFAVAVLLSYVLVLLSLPRARRRLDTAWEERPWSRLVARALLIMSFIVGVPLLWIGWLVSFEFATLASLAVLLLGTAASWYFTIRLAADRSAARSALRRSLANGVLVLAAVLSPFVAWSAGIIPPYPLAMLLAVLAGGWTIGFVLLRPPIYGDSRQIVTDHPPVR